MNLRQITLCTVGALCFSSVVTAQTNDLASETKTENKAEKKAGKKAGKKAKKKHGHNDDKDKTAEKKQDKKSDDVTTEIPAAAIPNSVRNITWRMNAQQNIAQPTQILDGQFIPIGQKEPNATIIEDGKNKYLGHTVYKFNCDGETNRIELTSAFASVANLKGRSQKEINYLKEIKDAYIGSEHGDYGNTIVYDWYTKFPDAPSADKGGIFAQIHGRPDRALVKNPQGEVKRLSQPEMEELLKTMYFDDGDGKDKITKKLNGWKVDASAGGPIAALLYRPTGIYMMMRSSSERVSNDDSKVRPLPDKVKVGEVIGKDGKEGFLAFNLPISEVPVNKWIHFRLEIKYSKYSHNEDKVLEKGYVKTWMDDKQICDLKNINIGKNDELGPYFKYGIYKPQSKGFTVEHCGFKETVKK